MTAAPRIDIATDIHNGIRKLLFEQAVRFASCDFRAETAWRPACEALDACFVMLRERADHEAIVIAPLLVELDAQLAREAERQRHALEHHMREVERATVALRFSSDAERLELGRALGLRFDRLVAAVLAQLAFIETHIEPVFRREKTDQELIAIRVAMRSLLTPVRRAAWLALVSSAAAPTELETFVPSPESAVPLVA